MLERVDALRAEHRELEARLGDPALIADTSRFTEATKRYHELGTLLDVGDALASASDEAIAARELMAESDPDEREIWRLEAEAAESKVAELTEELRLLLLPKDPNDGRNVIVEVRGAEGGEEANLFARDLFEMYQSFAQRQGWKLEVLGTHHSDLGGFNDITFGLRGDTVWTRMKFEAGPHRVQRVPVTESQGRVHTSSATVTVVPEADEVEVNIDPNDLQIDTYRSSGAGGQHVNTTDSAVRITHRPSGLVVSMQDEKSQLQNRDRAMKVLRSRLLQLEKEAQREEASSARRDQTGGGGRSEKIRTYNFKENRVSEHRIGLTVYNLDKVLAGDLGEISDALLFDERSRQLANSDGQ